MALSFEEAMRYHQQGRLDEAEQAYAAILQDQPNHPDALHLLGVAALQRRQPARAVELIVQAIKLRPSAAAFHSNLGESYRALGRLDESAEACRRALKLQPDYADAANNLGMALQGMEQLEAAAEALREAVRLKRDFPLAHNNLGNVLGEMADWDGAIASYREAVHLAPNWAAARSNLGQALLERSSVASLEEALVHCREAVRLTPQFAGAHNNLGNVFREMGRLDEAKSSYLRAIQLDEHVAMPYNNMARALHKEGRLDEAQTYYRKSLALEPKSARFHTNFAGLLLEREHVQQAVAECRRAIELDPKYAAAHEVLAAALQDAGCWQEAAAAFTAAIQCPGLHPTANCGLGRLHVELGRFEQAQRCFRDALCDNPREAGEYYGLATHMGKDLGEDDLAAIRGLLDDKYLSPEELASLHHALAHVFDARGQFDDAFEHMRQANSLHAASWQRRGLGYDPQEHSSCVDRIIELFTTDRISRLSGGIDSQTPVFIVGLPRSGTTLLEQILASHPRVFGAGELPLIHQALESLPGMMNRPNDDFVTCASQADSDTVRRVAENHLAQLRRHSATAARITDKMPDNYLWLGWIRILFPKARIIHCTRDCRDVAVSCLITSFRSIRWACQPEHIAGRIANYRRVMDHWRKVMGGDFLEVSYESLVADIEPVSRRMVEWIGLDWDPACLSFYQNRRPIKTASVSQVRKPIYSRSVGRWKNYAAPLAALMEQL